MSSYYDTMQVCRRWGHQITSMYQSYRHHAQKFCEKCGSATTTTCDACQKNIRGYLHVEGVIGGSSPDVPLNCHECGAPYPWKSRLLAKRIGAALISPLKYLVDVVAGFFKK